MRRYVLDEHVDKKGGAAFDISDWTDEIVRAIPQQINECDCGVFASKFADFLSEGVPLSFKQADMPYFRRRMTLEIMNGRVL